jgi:hypothetical protein
VNDGVKYYLFKTLSNLLGVPSKTPLLKKDTEARAVQAALDFVEKPVTFPRVTPLAEIDGYRVLRCEAVKVAAHSSSATVGDKGRPVLTLARVAAGDVSISPPPHISERLEATVGLARLLGKVAAKPGDLQLDAAAAQVARGVKDFAFAANPNIKAVGVSRIRPWKIEAARLIEAIGSMKGEGKNTFVNDVVKRSLEVLTPLERGEAGSANSLDAWLKDTARATADKPLFKGDDKSAVKVPDDSKE